MILAQCRLVYDTPIIRSKDLFACLMCWSETDAGLSCMLYHKHLEGKRQVELAEILVWKVD